jgi:predicted nuclease of predicted toxin-antitoxin system
MRVLLDENLDARLKPLFADGLEVLTVAELGWDALQNGALLAAAAQAGFDALVTMDRNIPYQQNLKNVTFGIVIIRAYSNSKAVVAPLMPNVNRALAAIQPGEVVYVGP